MKGCKTHQFAFCNIQCIDCAFLKRTRLWFFNLSELVDTTVPYLLQDFRCLELTETLLFNLSGSAVLLWQPQPARECSRPCFLETRDPCVPVDVCRDAAVMDVWTVCWLGLEEPALPLSLTAVSHLALP